MKYGIILWLTDGCVKKFFVFEKKVICLIFMIKRMSILQEEFKAHKILTMASIYILEVLYFIKNYINIEHNYDVHKYDTRSSHDLSVSGCTTYLYQNNVLNAGIKLYNKLPENIKRLHTLHNFKKELKSIFCKMFFIL